MYDNYSPLAFVARRTRSVFMALAACAAALAGPVTLLAEEYDSASVIRKISDRNEKLELTTNTSRILTLEKNIPRVQVNNPDLVAVTPLSATEIQISAKKAGVTQVNLWDEEGNIHTVDVLIYGDARELTVALQTQFPNSSIRVYRYSESLVLTGFVDRPDHIGPIMRLAEDYAPKVINNISTGGVQQILLKVKVMEISRTRLRELGTDWAFLDGNNVLAASNVSQLLASGGSIINSGGGLTKVGNLAGQTFQFGVFDGDDVFLGFLSALQRKGVGKILAEPNLVAVSGRPAQFNVGGEFPVPIPQSLGTTSIEFKPFGTQVDFLPIVLGNGNIRLEVRPRISEIDFSIPIEINGTQIPSLKVRQVDTAVEMKASQTFALAGLIQERTVSTSRGFPYLSDLPVLGVPFRKTENNIEEIELLVLVTPEFVDPIDAHEAPCGGPGYATTNPTNRQLYCAGHVEVPAHCNPISGMTACGEDGCDYCRSGAGCNTCSPYAGGELHAAPDFITDGGILPGGTGYDDGPQPQVIESPVELEAPAAPDDLQLPAEDTLDEGSVRSGPSHPAWGRTGQYTRPREPVFLRNASRPQNQSPGANAPAASSASSGLIGPVGYDAQ